jgi:phosphoribosylaminoimidazole-succinocarboxamide synthase
MTALPDAPPDAPSGARPDTAARAPAVFETHLRGLPLLARGKVRDNYAVGRDRLLMVASDRISAFDRVLPAPVPGKGVILTRMALFWFDLLADIVPNHLTGEDPLAAVQPDEVDQVRDRAMLVRRLQPVPVEAVVRGYLAGSGYKEYAARGTVCGVALPPGLQLASRLPEPIFTPATKAAVGEHDENISFEQMAAQVGGELAARIREVALALYARASAHALARGIIIADTKFEFGLDERGTLVLMDEVLTPDSSRFWPQAGYAEGRNPPSLDKQPLRDWLEARAARLGQQAWPQADDPQLQLTLAALARGYADVLERLTA